MTLTLIPALALATPLPLSLSPTVAVAVGLSLPLALTLATWPRWQCSSRAPLRVARAAAMLTSCSCAGVTRSFLLTTTCMPSAHIVCMQCMQCIQCRAFQCAVQSSRKPSASCTRRRR